MPNTVSDDIISRYSEAAAAHKEAAESGFPWDEREELFFYRYKHKGEEERTRSTYSTGELQGIVLDSVCRVMAQMPTGRFRRSEGTELAHIIAANLIYHEHIIPNANQGGDFFTKSRQVNLYSKVYGTMPVYVDWIESERYTGPDMVLIHPRRFKPQPYKYTIEDMDYAFVDSIYSKQRLEDLIKDYPEVWGNAGSALNSETTLGGSESDILLTNEERKNVKEGKAIVIRHYYAANGDGQAYDPVSKHLLINEKDWNPGLPLVDKQTIPLLDRYWCLCPYEQGETPQKSIDTLVRMYLDSVEYSLEPPIVMDPRNVVLSTIGWRKKHWFAKKGKVNEILPQKVSPQGLATFQTTHGIIKANLLSLGATTDTTVPKDVDPGHGKTPQALKMQAEREGARDSWDRYMQERFLEKFAEKSMALVVKRGGIDGVNIENVEEALKKIKMQYENEDVSFIGENGKIDEDAMKEIPESLKYEVDEGSTAKKTDGAEKLLGLVSMIEKNPEFKQGIEDSGKKINYGELANRVAIETGVQDWEEILIDVEKPDSVAGIGEDGETIAPEGEDMPQMPVPVPEVESPVPQIM